MNKEDIYRTLADYEILENKIYNLLCDRKVYFDSIYEIQLSIEHPDCVSVLTMDRERDWNYTYINLDELVDGKGTK